MERILPNQLVFKKEDINLDKNQVSNNYNEIPLAIVNHSTGINAVDQAIKNLYEFGYMHNHMRMYVSSIVCNISRCHWLDASKWMYYHLFDADWGSNSQNWHGLVELPDLKNTLQIKRI